MAQPKFDCFAVTPPGAEELCVSELNSLGIEARAQTGGVAFAAIARDLYRINLWSRVASRVLVRLGEFKCRDFPTLYKQLLKLPWGRFVRPGQVCGVRVSCQTSRINHSGRIAETVLSALNKVQGGTPGDSATEQLIFTRIENDICMVSIDSSGELLHRRGYRKAMVAAPLRENLAAAILLKLGYDGSQVLVDAMCGSGTFAIEAALIAAGIAPGRLRRFSFMDWPHYRPNVWALCLQEAGRKVEHEAKILAIDCDPLAIAAARKNAAAAGVDSRIRFSEARMEDLKAPAAEGVLVMNPPYGERLGDVERLRPLYADFGRLCRGSFKVWTIGWILAHRKFEPEVKIGCRRLWSFSNGGIRVDLRVRSGWGKVEKS